MQKLLFQYLCWWRFHIISLLSHMRNKVAYSCCITCHRILRSFLSLILIFQTRRKVVLAVQFWKDLAVRNVHIVLTAPLQACGKGITCVPQSPLMDLSLKVLHLSPVDFLRSFLFRQCCFCPGLCSVHCLKHD